MQPQDRSSYYEQEFQRYQQTRIEHWNSIAQGYQRHQQGSGVYYHRRLVEIYRFLVQPNQRVLEVGCGRGDLLAAMQPSFGVGVDFSPQMIALARERHPHLCFIQADVHNLDLGDELFDVVILSDTVNDLYDVQRALEAVHRHCLPSTRLIINFYSRLWELPLAIARSLRLATPTLEQNWLTIEDLQNLLNLAGFETIRSNREVLWPLPFGGFFNRYLARLWPFNHLSLANFLIARPAPTDQPHEPPLVSVIVPARNEAGNVQAIFERVPEMGSGTELVFVEGNSTDRTFQAIQEAQAQFISRRSILLKQPGKGKGDAVRAGYERATGEVLMILDADLTVPPEDLPRFYEALVSRKGEFINGVRLVYPMEKNAMRFFNFLGNKFFSLAFSWLLGQPVKDTLCGTKVLWKKDYLRIAANRAYFGDFDPFGDFDLIFGAAYLNLKIVDLPIRYRERTYGTTNISRWVHGMLLLRMLLFAARRIKFI